jgi:hypothetical protein
MRQPELRGSSGRAALPAAATQRRSVATCPALLHAPALPTRRAAAGGKRGTSAAEDLRQGSQRASEAMSGVMRQLQDTAGSTSEWAP